MSSFGEAQYFVRCDNCSCLVPVDYFPDALSRDGLLKGMGWVACPRCNNNAPCRKDKAYSFYAEDLSDPIQGVYCDSCHNFSQGNHVKCPMCPSSLIRTAYGPKETTADKVSVVVTGIIVAPILFVDSFIKLFTKNYKKK